jgi:hypothetical protein
MENESMNELKSVGFCLVAALVGWIVSGFIF